MDKKTLLIYGITDDKLLDGRDFCACVEEALKGGVTILQLREKNADRRSLIDRAKRVKEICVKYNVSLIINDDYKAAVEAGADGVHLGTEDESIETVRKNVGDGFIIGATAKTVSQAAAAEAAGADYLGVGAVFSSPTKTNAVRITKEMFHDIRNSTSLPMVAIGGINADNLAGLRDLGADGFAFVSAIFGQGDIMKSTRGLKNIIETF